MKGIIVESNNYNKKAVAIVDPDLPTEKLVKVEGVYQVGEEVIIPEDAPSFSTPTDYFYRLAWEL